MTTNVTPQVASDLILQCDIKQHANDVAASTNTGFPLVSNFPPRQDINGIYTLLQGYTQQFFPLVPYKHLLTTEDEIDDVHGEIAETQKRWSSVMQVRAFAIPSQIMQPNTAFGIEDVRTIELLIAVPDLVSAKLATVDATTYDVSLIGGIGDVFYYHNRTYLITTCTPAAFFANSDITLYYHIQSELYRGFSQDLFGPY